MFAGIPVSSDADVDVVKIRTYSKERKRRDPHQYTCIKTVSASLDMESETRISLNAKFPIHICTRIRVRRFIQVITRHALWVPGSNITSDKPVLKSMKTWTEQSHAALLKFHTSLPDKYYGICPLNCPSSTRVAASVRSVYL